MTKMISFFRELHDDKNGASFIEYTALLGVILAVGIGVLAAVGTWANNTWTFLCSTLVSNAASGVATVTC